MNASTQCAYPPDIEEKLGSRPALAALGDLDLLQCRPLALFCSIKCPGDVILRTYDLIRALRDAGIPTIGGFHSPMEKECLLLLLRGTQPVIVCPARGVEGMRLPVAWKQPLADKRLLVLSPFPKTIRRVTADTSQTRNLLVGTLAHQILIAHAGAGSKTEAFCHRLLSWGKVVWTVASKENQHLVTLGARSLELDRVSELRSIKGSTERGDRGGISTNTDVQIRMIWGG